MSSVLMLVRYVLLPNQVLYPVNTLHSSIEETELAWKSSQLPSEESREGLR